MKRWALLVVGVAGLNVARADVPVLAPNLYETGNLRVALACADHGFVTPEDGLRVLVDGQPVAPVVANAQPILATDNEGSPILTTEVTDVGFLVNPGRHRVRFLAPDCAADERDLELSASYAEHVNGRLAVDDQALLGPAVAPDGFGFTLGAIAMPLPPGFSAVSPITVPGLWISSSIERRTWLFAADSTSGWSSLDETNPVAASGSMFVTTATLRFGRRIARDRYALAAGTGIGAGLWIASLQPAPSAITTMRPADGITFDWNVPVWSALTMKAGCSWGVQALASYQLRPTDIGASTLALALGLLWQPSHACSDAPGLVTSP